MFVMPGVGALHRAATPQTTVLSPSPVRSASDGAGRTVESSRTSQGAS